MNNTRQENIEHLNDLLNKRSSRPPAPTTDIFPPNMPEAPLPLQAALKRVAESQAEQSTADKLEILAGCCGIQALEARRYGRAMDAAEWMELREWIRSRT